MPKRPNILLIMSDNQPADAMGCSGNDELHTPHLDALAQRGTRFANAFCVNAMCSPCRASVLTGLMPSQHGIHNWLDDTRMARWPENWSAIGEFPTLPSLMKQAGYATAMIGKFHLGVPFTAQLGFDHWVTMPHGHTTSFFGTEIIENGTRSTPSGHSVDIFADKTVEFLESRADGEEPFFAFVPFNGPYGHWPAIAGRGPEPHADLYDDCPMQSVPREAISSHALDRFAQRVASGGLREQFKGPLVLPNNLEALRNYYAQITLMDAAIGRIMDTLERLDMREDTIVIFTADHGFSLGHNGVWGHGAAAFPASAHRPSYHIPLIMAGTGIAEGEVSTDLISQIDLFPTLAKLAGINVPPTGAQNMLTSPARDAVFMEQEETRAIRTANWLYVERFADADDFPMGHELYDLKADPGEHNNLIASQDHTDIITDLSSRLEEYFAAHSDPKYDLWSGGTAKSNVTFDGLWKNAWGSDWRPEFS